MTKEAVAKSLRSYIADATPKEPKKAESLQKLLVEVDALPANSHVASSLEARVKAAEAATID